MENKTTLEELYKVAYLLDTKAYIAGGFYKDIIKGKEPKDIDIFCTCKASYNKVVELIERYEGVEKKNKPVSVSIGRFEVIKPVVIQGRLLFGQPEDLVATFDIVIAQVWIDAALGICFVEDDIDEQIENGVTDILVLEGDEDRTYDRMERYKSYGFELRNENKQINKLDWNFKENKSSMAGGY